MEKVGQKMKGKDKDRNYIDNLRILCWYVDKIIANPPEVSRCEAGGGCEVVERCCSIVLVSVVGGGCEGERSYKYWPPPASNIHSDDTARDGDIIIVFCEAVIVWL